MLLVVASTAMLASRVAIMPTETREPSADGPSLRRSPSRRQSTEAKAPTNRLSPTSPVVWTNSGSVFHIASDVDGLKELINNAEGRSDSLASSENFTKVVTKLGDGQLFWFLDVNKAIKLMVKAGTAAQGGDAAQAEAMLQNFGINGFKAVGGTMSFGSGPYDTISKTFLLVPAPVQGLLKMFSMPAAALRPALVVKRQRRESLEGRVDASGHSGDIRVALERPCARESVGAIRARDRAGGQGQDLLLPEAGLADLHLEGNRGPPPGRHVPGTLAAFGAAGELADVAVEEHIAAGNRGNLSRRQACELRGVALGAAVLLEAGTLEGMNAKPDGAGLVVGREHVEPGPDDAGGIVGQIVLPSEDAIPERGQGDAGDDGMPTLMPLRRGHLEALVEGALVDVVEAARQHLGEHHHVALKGRSVLALSRRAGGTDPERDRRDREQTKTHEATPSPAAPEAHALAASTSPAPLGILRLRAISNATAMRPETTMNDA